MIAEFISREVSLLATEDEDIRRAERNVSFRQIEEILWGNATKQGLSWIMAEQAKCTESLSTQIQKITAVVDKLVSDVNGADGVRPDIKELKKDVVRLNLLEPRIEIIEQRKFNSADMEELKRKSDRDHEIMRTESRDGRSDILKTVEANKQQAKAELDTLRKEYRESKKEGPIAGWIVGMTGLAIAGIDVMLKVLGVHK